MNAAASLLSDDFTVTGVAPQLLDKQAYLTFQSVHNQGFSDWNFHARVSEAKGDTVRANIQITATHDGTYDVSPLGLPVPPIPATGKYRHWPPELVIFTLRDGKIINMHVNLGPGGGIPGTLVWLGVPVPAPQS